jgi:propanol-preferring alcohol dehydrogenase
VQSNARATPAVCDSCRCHARDGLRRRRPAAAATRSSASPKRTGGASACRGWAGRAPAASSAAPAARTCERARFTGCDIDGGFAEYAVADERHCFALPSDWPPEQAAPLRLHARRRQRGAGARARARRRLRSVANLTRADGSEFLELAPRVPVVTHVTTYPLQRANEALADLRCGRLTGAAVIVP